MLIFFLVFISQDCDFYCSPEVETRNFQHCLRVRVGGHFDLQGKLCCYL